MQSTDPMGLTKLISKRTYGAPATIWINKRTVALLKNMLFRVRMNSNSLMKTKFPIDITFWQTCLSFVSSFYKDASEHTNGLKNKKYYATIRITKLSHTFMFSKLCSIYKITIDKKFWKSYMKDWNKLQLILYRFSNHS